MPLAAPCRLPLLVAALLAAPAAHDPARAGSSRPREDGRPSFVLVLSDDQGWGDAGYNGDPVLRTPNLDAMARGGVRFDRFYAAGPLCAPTRAGVLTGRFPFRSGVMHSLHAVLPREETTIAEILRDRGYSTGHFGKWHLGSLGGRGSGGSEPAWEESPPWEHGFQVCFSSESSLPTWDPLVNPETGRPSRAAYWTGPDRRAAGDFEGDASRVIMDRAVQFLRASVKDGRPFLAVIWLHAPHYPVVAGGAYRAMYGGGDGNADLAAYRGCLTAMDGQIGRLRSELRALGVAERTALFFASDNGPVQEGYGKAPEAGSAGPFRGGKAELLEGGIRVPALLEWPERTGPRVVTSAWSVLDYLPTLAAAAGAKLPAAPLDGESLLPLLAGEASARSAPLFFRLGLQTALVDGRYKLSAGPAAGSTLHDLDADPGEERDLSGREPEVLRRMLDELDRARASWPPLPPPGRR